MPENRKEPRIVRVLTVVLVASSGLTQLGLRQDQRLTTLERIHRKWEAIGQPPVQVA